MVEKMSKFDSPLVSVLIPAYNHENYVQSAIKSIISQTYENIELLVINDGSTDSTWKKICEMESECQKRFVRSIFWNQKNVGNCKTLNELLDNARGDYIYIIASDDQTLPNAIAEQVIFLESDKTFALCVGDNEIIDDKGKICYWDENRNIVYDKADAKFLTFASYLQFIRGFDFSSYRFGSYKELSKGNHIPNGYMIRKESFKDFRFAENGFLDDWQLMLHISKRHKMKYLDKHLMAYRWHSSNTVKNSRKMAKMTNKTKFYERHLLKGMSLDKFSPETRRFLEKNLHANSTKRISLKLYTKAKLSFFAFVFALSQIPGISLAFSKERKDFLLERIFLLADW